MPNGVIQIDHEIEVAGVIGLKIQSPSTLEWRLDFEVMHSCRFETTVTLGNTVRPHGQSPLPERIGTKAMLFRGPDTRAEHVY